MKKYLNFIGSGAIFGAAVLTMFFTLNPALVPVVLVCWYPLEKAIDKLENEEA